MNTSREELAVRFMAALLARDPLCAQRFTDIETRLAQLAGIAFTAADTFMAASQASHADHQRSWDYRAQSVPEVPLPRYVALTQTEKDLFADI